MKNKKVLVAISGGVDSSVTAKILKTKGYEVMGVYFRLSKIRLFDESYARRVCNQIGIKLYPLNISQKFTKEVIEYFLDSYAQGYTPNPCIKCNKVIKFKELIKLADVLGFDRVATGHYARILKNKDGSRSLLKGKDLSKDQSYFLYKLREKDLERILLPLGDYYKKDVQKQARNKGLFFKDSESQDICFINGDHNEFLKKYLDLTPGDIKDMSGKIVGKHEGLPLYTIGQRKGINIGGGNPFYVVKMDQENNILYVTDNRQEPELFSKKVEIKDLNQISDTDLDSTKTLEVVTRYGQTPQKCLVKTSKDKKRGVLEFEEPQRAITPGQSAVIYDREKVLGGGIIQKRLS